MKLAVSLSLLSVAIASPLTIHIGTIHQEAAPLLSSANAKVIPNAYIVKFKDHVKQEDAKAHHVWISELHTQHEERKFELKKRSQFPVVDEVFHGLKHTFDIAGSFLGYSGHFDDAVIEELRRNPDVSQTCCFQRIPSNVI
jgi:cerevisin